MQKIYLDSAASSPLDSSIITLLKTYLNSTSPGNPSSSHPYGKTLFDEITISSNQVLSLLGIPEVSQLRDNLLFTSGATESNNTMINGVMRKYKGCKVIIGPTEHSSVTESVKKRAQGKNVLLMNRLEENGGIDFKYFEKLLLSIGESEFVLVCQMMVNNQIGTVYNIEEMARIMMKIKPKNSILHVDAVQAIGKIPINIRKISSIGIPVSMSFSAHKINGPKGVGLLVYDSVVKDREKLDIHPLIYGGGQQSNLRSGTENIMAILAIRKTFEIAYSGLSGFMELYKKLYSIVIAKLQGQNDIIPIMESQSSHNIISLLTPKIPGQVVYNHLIERNIYCSLGSACHAKVEDKLHVNHVIAARLGVENSGHTIRFSFNKFTTTQEVEYSMNVLLAVVKELVEKNVKSEDDDNVMKERSDPKGKENQEKKMKKKKKKKKKVYVTDQVGTFCRILCRVGELSLKKGNRKYFERQLHKNIVKAVNEVCPCNVDRKDRRIYVKPKNEIDYIYVPQVAQRLTKVFGLVNVSLSCKVESEFEKINQAVMFVCKKKLNELKGEIYFRISAKRSNKNFPMTSMEIQRVIGANVIRLDPKRFIVNLKNPSYEIGIDVRSEGTYIYTEKIMCEGGFPVGTTGKGLTLLSGGFDSPVASFMMMKRGMTVNFVSFFSFPYTSQRYNDKIKRIVEVLAQYQQTPSKIYFIPLTKIQEAVRDNAPEPYRTIMYRRSMNYLAMKVAKKINAQCLITGESLGQVASQTIRNITSIQEPVGNFPILRPLIGMDKCEIIDIAHRIGTYDISNTPEADTCTLFQPKNPIIHSKLDDTHKSEEKVPNFQVLLQEAYDNALIYDVSINMFKVNENNFGNGQEIQVIQEPVKKQ